MNSVEAYGIGSSRDSTNQYLTFILDDEEYGIDILQVQEIRGWSKTRPIPNSPSWLKGIIDLRGSIVPIIDLRERFHIAPLEYGPNTVVIVVRFHDEKNRDQRDLGIVVDAVSEVYSVAPKSVKSAPNVGSAIDEQLIEGIAMINDKMIVLLDMDRLREGILTPGSDIARTIKQEAKA
ncbi:chemotaxis protein CheW [Chromatocurvus halotolerans]|uniref:Chemotaxis protein CheW n=1 Tax=Chromatocurvus halotolerans TaxID=1132028 RepID=A0A4V2SBR4_9GAMM|nr:chemotaxis protein CheW [Chromatocurvus halotolerans]TCO76570.1 purine-binding chemotaxis protein CheW [Chromatocurvus halotolerans]